MEPLRERMQLLYNNLPTACASPPKLRIESTAVSENAENRISVISEGAESLWMNDTSSIAGLSQCSTLIVNEEDALDSFAVDDDVSEQIIKNIVTSE